MVSVRTALSKLVKGGLTDAHDASDAEIFGPLQIFESPQAICVDVAPVALPSGSVVEGADRPEGRDGSVPFALCGQIVQKMVLTRSTSTFATQSGLRDCFLPATSKRSA